MKSFSLIVFLVLHALVSHAQQQVFELGTKEFLLDKKPIQIIGGEIHPARVPAEYWRHRVQMAKAMGCNTIAAYLFWNYHETAPGNFDFKTGNKNLAQFLKICKEENMWVLLRPGPYVCAEWEFGGIPPYLLRIPDIKLRCMDTRYMQAVERYFKALSPIIKPFLMTNGGNILMVQIENEYGSYGNDKTYLQTLRDLWIKNGVNVPFFTADGPTPYMLDAGTLQGAAIGLDSGSDEGAFEEATKQNPNVPSFSSETYPGWLTHWGEKWAKPDTASLLKEVKFLMDNKKSFSLYVIHGGTNFGFTAGANAFSPTQYQPDITSYDYDAPINEQGQATSKYLALRKLIRQYVPNIPDIPAPIPVMEIPEITLQPFTAVWNNLPLPVKSAQPKSFEALEQDYGFVMYKTKLIGHKSGKLTLREPHDYATVFLNGKYVGHVYRDGGNWTINLPKTDVKDPILEILVEGMGRINFAEFMIDRKGITDRVTLNGMTLMNWEMYKLPFDTEYIQKLKRTALDENRSGIFFKGKFSLTQLADTYFDVAGFKKGIVWINGHNLGRYWEIGPQKRLYCPASWLKKGENEILIFDLHQQQSATVSGKMSLYE